MIMKEKHSVKKCRTESVMWILYQDNKILVEDRPKYEQGESRCIPCGHIDLNRDKDIEGAFLRESQEEFESGNFKAVEYEFLTSIDFDEINKQGGIDKLTLHYFVVTKWDGEIPEYTMEHNKKHADLVWLPISEYKQLPQSCDRRAIKELLLNNNLNDDFKNAIKIVSKLLSKKKWALIGSTNLAIQGMDVKPRDLDVVVQLIDLDEMQEIFSKYNPSEIKKLKSLTDEPAWEIKVEIKNIEVQILAEKSTGEYVRKLIDNQLVNIPLDNIEIPCFTLEIEAQAYLETNRENKARLIQEFLK